MYFLTSLFYLLGGIMPLGTVLSKLKVNKSICVLGWLSWVAGVSVKFALAFSIRATLPTLYVPNTLQYIVLVTLLETTEVVSAYWFLKHHPGLREMRDLSGLLAFGMGFGAGEALTLAAFTALPVDVPLEFSVVWTMIERFSAIMVHIASAVFLGLYIIHKRKVDAALGLVSKDLAATLSVTVPLVLTAVGFAEERLLTYFELVIFVYGVLFLLVAFRSEREQETVIEEIEGIVDINYRSVMVSLIAFVLLSLLLDTFAATFYASHVLYFPVSLVLVVAFSLFVYRAFKYVKPKLTATEFSIGAFMGLATTRIGKLYFFESSALRQVPIQGLLFPSMFIFNGIVIALTIDRLIRREKLLS